MTKWNRWTGSFYDLSSALSDPSQAQVVIIPAPYQGSVSYRKGTEQGPFAIFQASRQVELFEPELGIEPAQIGICSIAPLKLRGLSPKSAVKKVEEAVRAVLKKGKKPVLLGGEHSLSIGAVRAGLQFFPGLEVLHLDAHSDLREQYEGDSYSHASVMRRILELGVKSISVGVRSLSKAEYDLIQAKELKVYLAHQLKAVNGWEEMIVRQLGKKIYITLDLDVLDPSEMPGVGTPEPAGLHYQDLIRLIKALANSGKEVIGIDLVELAPIKGEVVSEFGCARLLYQLLGWLWSGNKS